MKNIRENNYYINTLQVKDWLNLLVDRKILKNIEKKNKSNYWKFVSDITLPNFHRIVFSTIKYSHIKQRISIHLMEWISMNILYNLLKKKKKNLHRISKTPNHITDHHLIKPFVLKSWYYVKGQESESQ